MLLVFEKKNQRLFHSHVRDSNKDCCDKYGSSCNHAFLRPHHQELEPILEWYTLVKRLHDCFFHTIVACSTSQSDAPVQICTVSFFFFTEKFHVTIQDSYEW